MIPVRLGPQWGVRILPWTHMVGLYLEGGRTDVAGPWFRSTGIAHKDVRQIVSTLGLEYVDCRGRVQFGADTDQLGLLLFPLTAELRADSITVQTVSMGGDLPDAPVSTKWQGTGFGSGGGLTVEFRAQATPIPGDSQIWHMTGDGKVVVVAQFSGESWETGK